MSTTMNAPAPIVWVGRLAMVLSFVSIVILGLGDPLFLALPVGIAAVVLSALAVRRGGNKLPSAHIGLNVGLLDILLWVVWIIVM